MTALAAIFKLAIPDSVSRARPFLHFAAATDRATHPCGSGDRAMQAACRPDGYTRPRRTLVPQYAHVVAQVHGLPPTAGRQSVAGSYCGRSAFDDSSGDGSTASHSNSRVRVPVGNRGLAATVVSSMRSSASHQMVGAPSVYGSRHGPVCGPVPCVLQPDCFGLSCVRRNVWPGRNSAARSWLPR